MPAATEPLSPSSVTEEFLPALAEEKPLTSFSSPWIGPALALVIVVGIELARLSSHPLSSPGSLFFLAVLYASAASGLASGLLTALIAVLYVAYGYFMPGPFSHTDPEAHVRFLSIAINIPLSAVIVGSLRRREQTLHDVAMNEAVARRSREWFVTTLNSIGDAVIAVDTRRRVTFMNPIAETLTGWDERAAHGRPLEEVFRICDETTREPTPTPVESVLREGRIMALSNHTLLIARDGTERPIDDSASPIRDKAGTITGVVLVFHDVSQRRADESALRESEHLFRTTTEQSPIASLILDPEGNVLQANAAWEALYGVSRDELADYNVRHDPQLAAKGYTPLIERAFAGEVVQMPLLKYDPAEIGRPGRARWIQPFAYAVKDDDGKLKVVVVKIEDVHDREQALQSLRHSEERYHSLISASSQIIWTAGPDGAVDTIPVWQSFTGQSHAEVKGRGWLQAVHPEDREHAARTWSRAVANQSPYAVEYRVRRHDGIYRTFAVRGVPVIEPNGTVREWVGACTDITERKNAEALVTGQNLVLQLVATGSRLHETLNAIANLLEAHVCAVCAILAVDEKTGELEVCAAPSLPPGTHDALVKSGKGGTLARALREGPVFEDLDVAGEGAWAPLRDFAAERNLKNCWATPILSSGGEGMGVVALFAGHDRPEVAERRPLETGIDLAGIAMERASAEHELTGALAQQARTAANLSSIIGHIADAVVAVDANGAFVFVNEVARQVFGFSPDVENSAPSVSGEGVHNSAQLCPLLSAEGDPVWANEHPLTRADRGETVEGEWQIERPDGTRIWMQGHGTPVSDSRGSRIGALLTLHDVTAQRQSLREMERASRMKDEFLAIVSHELRTPLTPIMGWTSLLRQAIETQGQVDTEFVLQAADSIQRNADLQKRLVNDLLDTSRVISGKLSIEPHPADLNELVQSSCDSAARIASERSVCIECISEDKLPPTDLDVERIQQVLMNLLTNAIKFSSDNSTIKVVLSSDAGLATVTVTDTGEGIEPELLPHIFETFRQGDSSYTRRHGGMGLGLAISKSLVELHGGTLEAHSEGRGKGASFRFTLPLTVQANGHKGLRNASSLSH